MPVLKIDDDIALKMLEADDAEKLFRLVDNNRIYLREWLPWVDMNKGMEDSLLFIKTAAEQYNQNLGFQCGILYRDRLAGIIGFHRIDWMNRNVEIGYWIGEKFQGNGIIARACRTMVDYAFFGYSLNRVQIRCATGNKRSRAVIERLGFAQEGTMVGAEFLYDHYVDLNIYGMTAEKWRNLTGTVYREFVWSF
jgi:ribosomal-protein-serine acetyltransferase